MTSQPEYILEEKLVAQLQELGHKKVIIKNEEDLIKNLKIQLEIHNKKTFSEKEFEKEEFGAYKFVPMLQDRNK